MPLFKVRNETDDGWIILGWSSDGGSVADLAHEPYVTIGASGVLTHERKLTAGAGILITDGGANSAVVLAVDPAFIPSLPEGALGDLEAFAFFMGAAG